MTGKTVEIATISTGQGGFIAPHYLNNETKPAGVVGELKVSDQPFWWILEDGNYISDGGGNYWDTAPEPQRPIYMYHRKTKSTHRRVFDLAISQKNGRQAVVQAPKGDGVEWAIRYVSARYFYKTALDGTVAELAGSDEPFQWVLEDENCISDGSGMYWDTYEKPEPNQPVYLYHRKTESGNQRFKAPLDLSISTEKGLVVTRGGDSDGKGTKAKTAPAEPVAVTGLPTAAGPAVNGLTAAVTVVTTFNALASSCSGNFSDYEGELTTAKSGKSQERYVWCQNRFPPMIKKLEQCRSDILLLNELSSCMAGAIAAGLNLKSVEGGDDHKALNCAIMWAPDRFEPVGEPQSAQGVRYLTQRLRSRTDSTTFQVATAHLKSGESQYYETVRLGQLQTVLKHLAQLPSADVYILGGDLNTMVGTELYTSKVLKELTYNGWRDISGKMPTYHHWMKAKPDYIFVKGAATTNGNAAVVDTLDNPGPNEKQPSDHTPVSVTLLTTAAAGAFELESPVTKKRYRFAPNSTTEGDGLFKRPVYLSERAFMAKGQKKETPLLLVHSDDWEWLKKPEATHSGAFGTDHSIPKHVAGLSGEWVFVWKFPSDLNHLPGFKHLSIPVPVGTYPFFTDRWSSGGTYTDQPHHHLFPLNGTVVKFRTDSPSGMSVHHLQSGNGAKVAMISSNLFVQEFWAQPTPKEIENVKSLIRKLREECGICARSVWGQHHAFVFYIDKSNGTLLTPQKMASILQNPTRGAKVRAAIAEHNLYQTKANYVREWASLYIKTAAQV